LAPSPSSVSQPLVGGSSTSTSSSVNTSITSTSSTQKKPNSEVDNQLKRKRLFTRECMFWLQASSSFSFILSSFKIILLIFISMISILTTIFIFFF
jgi:hypothetical protein